MGKLPIIRTAYDDLQATADPGVKCTKEESKTIQAHKEYCDIDKQIMLAGAGHILLGNAKTPVYADVSELPKDIHSHFQAVKQFEADFMQHTPEVRLRFDNNPAKMAEFLVNPANMEESYNLGLRVRPVKSPAEQEAERTEAAKKGASGASA